YCSRANHDLHSFPTRRSSDLLDSKGRGGKPFKLTVRIMRGAVPAQNAKFTLTLPAGNYAAILANSGLTNTSVKAKSVTVVWSMRSEEHTSELQSRENLVCRLL